MSFSGLSFCALKFESFSKWEERPFLVFCLAGSLLRSNCGDNEQRTSLKDPLLVKLGDLIILSSISWFLSDTFGDVLFDPWKAPSFLLQSPVEFSQPFSLVFCLAGSLPSSAWADNELRTSLIDPLLVKLGDLIILSSISWFLSKFFWDILLDPRIALSLLLQFSGEFSRPFTLATTLAKLLERLDSTIGVRQVIRSTTSWSMALPRLDRVIVIADWASTFHNISDMPKSSSLGEDDPVFDGETSSALITLPSSSVYERT